MRDLASGNGNLSGFSFWKSDSLLPRLPVPSQVTKRQLQESQELELLEDAGAIPSVKKFKQMETRYNTRLQYVQKKYNLLREESEGYAKLLTLLLSAGEEVAGSRPGERPGKQPLRTPTPAAANGAAPSAPSAPAASLASFTNFIKAHIGYYELDPTRVCDLVLWAYEQHPDNPAFVHLMTLFNPDAIRTFLGLRFQLYEDQYQQVKDAAAQQSKQPKAEPAPQPRHSVRQPAPPAQPPPPANPPPSSQAAAGQPSALADPGESTVKGSANS